MNSRISQAFSKGRQSGRPLFVSYLCAGDPTFDVSLAACRALINAGADLLELGAPFSDPLADGLTNQLAAQRALENGMTQTRVLELVRAIREFSEVPIVLYTYYNLVFAPGEANYARQAKEAGVDGFLVLDLPPEEAASWKKVCADEELGTVFIIAPTTPPDRIAKISETATGFLYYVSRTGVTGERADLSADLSDSVAQIRSITDLPLVVGFGVSQAEHVATIGQVADGVVVGSALVNCLAANPNEPEKAVAALRAKADELIAGIA
ncbi:tryptophan synthase subunit alpha [Cerasicoccus arenae]|uniref:Tryptophan synthase alpha chain n=1 Tax=Cerasicoccus arenae TaxID=424488 RepID=A0A8J3DAL5_9BACT|nr:tryptophan synthase subunit alpha [Cerasicoccus arenae]MBK1857528.1 tryptophan synthase subunit alpha [Cerasicoccus arenae]GHB95532.1 tryptophan synthase alpha chain [Cerasicoccus arenae]